MSRCVLQSVRRINVLGIAALLATIPPETTSQLLYEFHLVVAPKTEDAKLLFPVISGQSEASTIMEDETPHAFYAFSRVQHHLLELVGDNALIEES